MIIFDSIVALCVFLISLLGTRLMIIALRRRAVLMDRPNLRSNHKTPTPRGGGIAVVMALIIGLLVADINYAIILSLFMLAAVSLLDDLIQVPPLVRLLVQLLSVLLAMSMMPPVWDGFLPLWLDHAITVLLWMWFTNLFNFMDGIDGIAAGEMISIGIGFCLLAAFTGAFPHTLFAYSLIIAAAGWGFLWWNWHPAKIFLGDVGSIPIGFLLGYLLFLAAGAGYVFPALILPAYYLSDGTITLAHRLWRRQKIWVAHSEHYYQKAVRQGRRHDTVARYVLGINIILALLSILSVLDPDLALLYLATAYMAVFMMLGFFAHEPSRPHEQF